MKMFKYLLLSIVCIVIPVVHAQEPITAKVEDAVAPKAQEPVVVKAEVPAEQKPVDNDKELAEGKNDDFAEWEKSLEMTDEEKAQFLQAMNDDMDQENENISSENKSDDKDESLGDLKDLNDVKSAGDVEHKNIAPVAKVAPVENELPKSCK